MSQFNPVPDPAPDPNRPEAKGETNELQEGVLGLIDESQGIFMDENGVLTSQGEALLSSGLGILLAAANRQAAAGGWNNDRNSVLEELALVVSEVAEAMEEVRDGCPGVNGLYYDTETQKPEGIASELGDVLIRVAHLTSNPQFGKIDLVGGVLEKLRFNPTRSHRHGGRLA